MVYYLEALASDVSSDPSYCEQQKSIAQKVVFCFSLVSLSSRAGLKHIIKSVLLMNAYRIGSVPRVKEFYRFGKHSADLAVALLA